MNVNRPSRRAVADRVDHTLLRPEATARAVEEPCQEAMALGVVAVRVSPTTVPVAARSLDGSPVAVATVVGFASGVHQRTVKAHEATLAIADRAAEFVMVIDLGAPAAAAAAAQWAQAEAAVATIRSAAPHPVVPKAILKSGLWSGAAMAPACAAAIAGRADVVKTSIVCSPSGDATVEAVAAMARAVGPDVGVKAPGQDRCSRPWPRTHLGRSDPARDFRDHRRPRQARPVTMPCCPHYERAKFVTL